MKSYRVIKDSGVQSQGPTGEYDAPSWGLLLTMKMGATGPQLEARAIKSHSIHPLK
jgi:hypothetical protein